ncbi:MAG: hypothetical protein IKY18_03605 [Oscillospiraceae bacterium]|nr:hypothetical protein [Oscillospiraceae bacterium]
MTAKYKKLAIILGVASILLTVGPMAVYIVYGFFSAQLVVQKVTLAASVLVVGLLTIVSLVNKRALRSRVWIVAFALYAVLDHYLALIIVFGVCQIVDELAVAPLARWYREKWHINHEIDKREAAKTE